MGNGPSLNDTLTSSSIELDSYDILSVNYFCRTEKFEQVKPNYYVITSPEYFIGEEKKDWKKDRDQTFHELVNKTKWDMDLFVPVIASKSKDWVSIISENPKIKIVYFNTTPIEGFKWFSFFCFKRKLGMPRPHNVLIPSIFIGLYCGYKNIYLAGADHNWTRDVFVTDDNRVLLSQKHFYDQKVKEEKNKNSASPKPMYKGGSQEERKLHEVLNKFVYAFQAYWEIEEYATKVSGSKIYNITPGSYIDAFEKVKK